MQTPNSPSQSSTWHDGLIIAMLFLAILAISLLSACSPSPHVSEDGLALDLQLGRLQSELQLTLTGLPADLQEVEVSVDNC